MIPTNYAIMALIERVGKAVLLTPRKARFLISLGGGVASAVLEGGHYWLSEPNHYGLALGFPLILVWIRKVWKERQGY